MTLMQDSSRADTRSLPFNGSLIMYKVPRGRRSEIIQERRQPMIPDFAKIATDRAFCADFSYEFFDRLRECRTLTGQLGLTRASLLHIRLVSVLSRRRFLRLIDIYFNNKSIINFFLVSQIINASGAYRPRFPPNELISISRIEYLKI